MFRKILIANRGEIALRIIRTCKELGIPTVAVYSTADRESLHVRFADEAVCIGPPPSRDSYLNIPALMSAVEVTAADAVHPGYGFLSENEKFASICAEYGVKFIGPTPEAIAAMGDKATAKETARRAGIPTVPGSEGVLQSLSEARRIASDIGYPVLLKATAGGGGKGMRIVWKPEDLEDAWTLARAEAKAAFGNEGLYMEKYIQNPRHIEIQVVGDQYGNVSHLSERDCTIQRRYQKLIEEAPSPVLTPELRKQIGEAAVKLAQFIRYESAGTVEFILDQDTGEFYFMEMNTRIQVEHPVTEEIFFFDLIKEQIKVAAGVPVSGRHYFPQNRWAMEVRINAEDPYNDFRPSPGRIEHYHKPGGHGVRVDSHVYAGYTIPPYYDSMIAKLIVADFSREEVINKMLRALDEFIIEGPGLHTTIPILKEILRDENFRRGTYNTRFLENWRRH
ncbi:MAG: acetyl-CoA carboxylase biotin carboxylase subunit [Bacteroidia bacterium]|nr:acetyl-CoA carboxylase biotin carboxylase subunit [Bacteroidia bacterium]MDW8014774.1 acetyl-CoA carboxylase biotin carboxylase subunit [Bacteroidia bacterium]